MTRSREALLVAGVLAAAASCATTSRTRYVAVPQPPVGKVGTVDSVRVTAGTSDSDTGADVVSDLLLGPLLFHDAFAPTMFSSAAGVETGAEPSNAPPAHHRTYEVTVTFEDGNQTVFSYDGYGSSPWEAGDRVVIARGGLARAS
jgi:hypothetical protein